MVDDKGYVSIGQRVTNINGYPFVVVDSYDLVDGYPFSLVIYYGDEGVMMGGSSYNETQPQTPSLWMFGTFAQGNPT